MEYRSCKGAVNGENPLQALAGRKVYIRSFGCALNHADSVRMEALIRDHGAIIAKEDQAEAVVVNTCTVVKKTEREVLRFLHRHADKELYVTGCMAAIQKGEICSVCQPVCISPSFLEPCPISLAGRVNEVIGLVPIARGCRGQCAYCIAQIARGPLRSEPIDAICGAIRQLTDVGIREIQLTAQDISAWGMDRQENLPFLLEKILSLPGRFRLRMGMMNPATLLPFVNELIPLFRHEKMYAFAHVPVQSGSDQVLQKMGRGYSAQDFLDLVHTLRNNIPDIWIATDVIIGFPEETEQDFQKTLDLIVQVRPNKVNITRFSPRPGTVAATLPDILERTKKERSRRISRLANRICLENNRLWKGRVVPVVAVEHIKPGTVVCRTPHYRSVILQENIPLGSDACVRITGAEIHYFTGKRVP
jgi:threonylcarbamoyladenosine tRNA methylthiotransferase CDKAL1